MRVVLDAAWLGTLTSAGRSGLAGVHHPPGRVGLLAVALAELRASSVAAWSGGGTGGACPFSGLAPRVCAVSRRADRTRTRGCSPSSARKAPPSRPTTSGSRLWPSNTTCCFVRATRTLTICPNWRAADCDLDALHDEG